MPASSDGAACGVVPVAPTLRGPASTLDRVVQALRSVRDPDSGADIVDAGWLRGLSIDGGEAELNLRMPRVGCTAMHIVAEAAFSVLRRELPDTDLYLRPLDTAVASTASTASTAS
ncbi:MAG: iron-sulfur cluster assembly protein [Burkholderiales bacterium]